MAENTLEIIAKLDADVREFMSKIDKAEKSTADGSSKMAAHFKKVGDAVDAVGRGMTTVGGSILKWGGIIGGGITGAAASIVKLGSDFETEMRLVNNMLSLSGPAYDQYKQQVLDLATSMGVDGTEAAKAMFKVISGGITKENSIEYLKVAMEAAKGQGADLSTVVFGLTGVMNAFGMKTSQAAEAADAMIAAAKFGSMTFADLSEFMFHASQMAGSVGISLQETAAAIAAITRAGVPARVAGTELKMIIQGLIKPSKDGAAVILEMAAALRRQGVDMGEAGQRYTGLNQKQENLNAAYRNGQINAATYKQASKELGAQVEGLTGPLGRAILKSQGLEGTLKLVADQDKKTLHAFDDLMGSVEGLAGGMSISGSKAQILRAALADVAKGAGATRRDFETAEKGFGATLERIYVTIKNTMIQLGITVLPMLSEALQKNVMPIITGFFEYVKQHAGDIKAYLGAKVEEAVTVFKSLVGWIKENKVWLVNFTESLITNAVKWGPTVMGSGLALYFGGHLVQSVASAITIIGKLGEAIKLLMAIDMSTWLVKLIGTAGTTGMTIAGIAIPAGAVGLIGIAAVVAAAVAAGYGLAACFEMLGNKDRSNFIQRWVDQFGWLRDSIDACFTWLEKLRQALFVWGEEEPQLNIQLANGARGLTTGAGGAASNAASNGAGSGASSFSPASLALRGAATLPGMAALSNSSVSNISNSARTSQVNNFAYSFPNANPAAMTVGDFLKVQALAARAARLRAGG